MEQITINAAGCTTALQFLAKINQALGIRISSFSALHQHLIIAYYPKIIFLDMAEFSQHCPYAFQELQLLLKRVQWHYQQQRKQFEYELNLKP